MRARVAIGRAAPAADELAPLPLAEVVVLAAAVDVMKAIDEATDEAEAPTDETDDLAELTALETDADALEAAEEADALAPEPLTEV